MDQIFHCLKFIYFENLFKFYVFLIECALDLSVKLLITLKIR